MRGYRKEYPYDDNELIELINEFYLQSTKQSLRANEMLGERMILRLEKGKNWVEVDPIHNNERWELPDLGTHSGGWIAINMKIYSDINRYVLTGYGKGYKSTMLSCCGGKGGERWDVDKAQWSCRDCGMVKSNDPNYIYHTPGNPVRVAGTFEFEPEYHKSGCDHQWISYTGLKDQYEFCKKCDVKK